MLPGHGKGRFRRACLALVAAVAFVGVAAGSGGSAVAIVGGSSISSDAAPWAVFLSVGTGPTQSRCSGVIIDPIHVIVAGHCTFHLGGRAVVAEMLVKAGISNFNAPETSVEQDRAVVAYRVHPGFRNTGFDVPDDVAVLTLSTPLSFDTPYVQPAALPTGNAPIPAGTEVVIAGFGYVVSHGTTSGPLKEMTATVEREGSCGPYTDSDFYLDANGVFICAYAPVAAACGGDSGAGFVTTGHRVVLGVLEDALPGCAPKSMELAAYVGAPEILSFIEGNDRPPTAPRLNVNALVAINGPTPVAVGETLRCSASGWPGQVSISYAFFDVTTGAFLRRSGGPAFLVPSSALGATLLCQVTVTNSGGTYVENSQPTTPVQPAA